MIRIRQVGQSCFRRRPLYEVEFADPHGGTWQKRTALPVFELEPHVGVAEAWSMIYAARDLWDRRTPEWVVGET